MRAVKDLIDEASDLCQGDAALARRLGWQRSQIADLRSGRHQITPETVALLCDVLELSGEECQRLAALCVVENPKNAARASVLRRAFFGCWALGVALLLPTNDATARTAAIEPHGLAGVTLYIVRSIMGALRQAWRTIPGPTLTGAFRLGRAAPAT